jgi:hypothetical protein
MNLIVWLFHGISHWAKHDSESFKRSISENNAIWDFILPAIAEDFADKSEHLDATYEEMPICFLIESILFRCPMDRPSNLTVKEINGKVANEMLSYLVPLFPREVVAADPSDRDIPDMAIVRADAESGLAPMAEGPERQTMEMRAALDRACHSEVAALRSWWSDRKGRSTKHASGRNGARRLQSAPGRGRR